MGSTVYSVSLDWRRCFLYQPPVEGATLTVWETDSEGLGKSINLDRNNVLTILDLLHGKNQADQNEANLHIYIEAFSDRYLCMVPRRTQTQLGVGKPREMQSGCPATQRKMQAKCRYEIADFWVPVAAHYLYKKIDLQRIETVACACVHVILLPGRAGRSTILYDFRRTSMRGSFRYRLHELGEACSTHGITHHQH